MKTVLLGGLSHKTQFTYIQMNVTLVGIPCLDPLIAISNIGLIFKHDPVYPLELLLSPYIRGVIFS